MSPDPDDPIPGLDAQLLADEVQRWDAGFGADDSHSLVDLVNRVLDKGVVITGDAIISVAGVDLVYLGFNAMLTSVSTARRLMRTRDEDVASPQADDA